MNRRDLIKYTLVAAAAVAVRPGRVFATGSETGGQPAPVPDARQTAPLPMPASGEIKVAFLISPGAEIVDFAGPWGVFEYVFIPSTKGEMYNPFKLYTVAASTRPVTVSGGMSIVPDYRFRNAPRPDVIVVPALDTDRLAPAALDWLRKVQKDTSLTMSVCNGSMVLGTAGLLDGKRATAHHGGYSMLRGAGENVTVIRGVRYVEDGKIATAGGLTSGMDLALRVVERYFGRAVAMETAKNLEYQSTGWMHPESNAEFAQSEPTLQAGEALDPVCGMAVDRATALQTKFAGKTYHFCGDWCRTEFLKHPKRFVDPR